MKRLIFSIFGAFYVSLAIGQGTADDYNRAYKLRDLYSSRLIMNSGVSPTFMEGGKFWYKTRRSSGEVYVVVDPSAKSKREQSDTAGLNIARPESPRQTNQELHFWSETDDERNGEPIVSPNGKYEASISGGNVAIKDLASGETRMLSSNAKADEYYSAYLMWSPDGKKLATKWIRQVPKQYIHYIESCPANQFQPRLIKQEYQKPGCELPQMFPCIFDIESGSCAIADSGVIKNQFSIEWLEWDSDSKSVHFEYNQRGHKEYSLMKLGTDGKLSTIVSEKSEKYINWTRVWRQHLGDGKHVLWTSERDNYNHIYLYDKEQCRLVRQVTKGNYYVREIQHVDEKSGTIYFSANGKNPGEDPYNIHYYKVRIDGSHLCELTPEPAMHAATLSPDKKYLVDVYSTPTQPETAVLRSLKDGKIIMELEKADISKLVENGFKAPEVFSAKGRDGKTDMWGIIYRPSNYDKSRKYPVIEYIYSGPGDQYVPKTFRSYNWWMTSIAELGFICVMVDGMTTSFRTKEFEEVCYKNLKDAGYEDHRRWILAAADKYGDMDTSRIGIYGCSAGGQEALSNLLLHPDFYKCAYSACGCHDNRMDKIWWNEQWLGYPIDKSYIEGSNIENAYLLCRPLMLVWGELDDNVDPASSMKVADALIKAGKNFEMIIIPGAHHTMGEDFGEHKRYDFFVKHLLEKDPPQWSEIEK